MRQRRKTRRGFTLLEVLVSVAILGIGITAIFMSQWVSFATVKHTRMLNEATGLARCKMTEVEWDLDQNGYQITDVGETGPCCEGVSEDVMSCSWRIEKPEFPQPNFGELNLETDLDFGPQSGPNLLGGGLGAPGGGSAPGAAALSFLKTGTAGIGKNGNDVASQADAFLGGADAAVDGLAAMVMQIVYPDLKAVFEAATRRVVVKVTWYEGKKQYAVELEQWVTNSKEAGMVANLGGLFLDEEE